MYGHIFYCKGKTQRPHRANGLPAVEHPSGGKYCFENGEEYLPKEKTRK